MKNEIKILIADDHPTFRRGLCLIIESDARLKVVAEAADGAQAVDLIKHHQPDIAILDVNMPALTGFEVVRELASFNLATRIIFLTMHKDEVMFNTALSAGVNGYLLKDSAVEDIIAGIKTVAAGENFISPSLTTFLFNRRRRAAEFVEGQPTINVLTESERRVLKLVAEDKTSREIADLLFISVRTIERHRQNICNKMNVHGSNALMKFAIKNKEQLL
jgi:DNA-binding NarL/FixJ family response regulator